MTLSQLNKKATRQTVQIESQLKSLQIPNETGRATDHRLCPVSQKCGQLVGLHRGVTGHFVCMHERAERVQL